MLGYPSNSAADELSLRMLGSLLEDTSVSLEVTSKQMLASELVTLVKDRGYVVVCIADLPPSAPSKSRYLVKKLRGALPDLGIVVGRWAPPARADDNHTLLLEAGASAVASTLLETRQQIQQLAQRVTRARAAASVEEVA
jgi:hypothetical protein